MRFQTLIRTITGLLIAIGCTTIMQAQNIDTIDQAIQKVKSIYGPDPATQNQLRAEAAKQIIMDRIRTTNPDNKLDPNLEKIDDELEKLRNSNIGGAELVKWTWDNRAGRCDEQLNVLKKILDASGVPYRAATSTLNHTFLVVNLAPDADLDNPWTWGPNAVAPDPWAKTTYSPMQAWESKYYFSEGEGFVGDAQDPFSTRQLIEKLQSLKNPNAIDINCKANMRKPLDYRKAINDYFKIPLEYRKRFNFRPAEDYAIEAGELELQNIVNMIGEVPKNDSIQINNLHGAISDLDGRLTGAARCSDAVKEFQKKVRAAYKLLPKLKTDASLGISDAIDDSVPDDIIRNTGSVKVTQYFVFLLTNASNGLYVGSEDSLKGSTRCGWTGGGVGCKPTDVVTYRSLAGPFATQEAAQMALCKGISETHFFPVGIGLKGKWGGQWYGLWNASVSDCPKQ